MIKKLYLLPGFFVVLAVVFTFVYAQNFFEIEGVGKPTWILPTAIYANNDSRQALNEAYVIEEAGSLEESADPFWWLDSGAMVYWLGNHFFTIQGDLSPDSRWWREYASSNPFDTDGGYHPQNLFRLITKKEWQNQQQEVYFKIKNYWISDTPSRNESNGILLISRYLDDDNLYYAGLRVDGDVVVKKKQFGTYSVLAGKKILPGKYDRLNNPNILPLNKWLGLKLVTVNKENGDVSLELYLDLAGEGDWQKVLEAIDERENKPLTNKAHAGLRTDFMDVEMKDYKIFEIE